VVQDPRLLSAEYYLLTTLVVKVAAMAVLAIMLSRYHRFRDVLIRETRDWPTRLFFAFGLGLPMAAGTTVRILLRYDAADMPLEGAFLAGLVTGPWAGALVGALIGLPSLVAGETLSLPFAVGCGVVAGGLRAVAPKEAIWRFSPLTFSELHKHVWRVFRRFKIDWQIILIAVIVGLELLRQSIAGHRPTMLFQLAPRSVFTIILECVAAVMCVAAPIKIWNTARIEHRLREHEKLLMQARLDGLTRQINPHFLFNTLTSISSLVRTNPETARMLILKLSNLLRRLLRSQDHFVPLRDELASVDEYLDIEMVRFGPQLTVEKDVAPDTLDVRVPSMLLQPLVENSIKHGISRKVGGGRVAVRSYLEGQTAVIEVDDNGVGMTAERLQVALTDGIGLSNVDERLRVAYGADAHIILTSEPGRGTVARIEVPVTPPQERAVA
jgi:two-component system, LytTR family, sensor kinase